MKKLHTFIVEKKEKIRVEEPQQDGNILVKFVENTVPVKIAFKKPDRKEDEEYTLVYDAEFSKALTSGIATYDMMRKAWLNSGGFEAEVDIEYLDNLFKNLNKLQNEYQKLILEKASDDELLELENKIKDINKKVIEYREREQVFFSKTAESRAQKKTVTWCVLNLMYIEKEVDGKIEYIPVFPGMNFETKKNFYYDVIEESDDSFEEAVFTKAFYFVQTWITNTSIKSDDFITLEEIIDDHIRESTNKIKP